MLGFCIKVSSDVKVRVKVMVRFEIRFHDFVAGRLVLFVMNLVLDFKPDFAAGIPKGKSLSSASRTRLFIINVNPLMGTAIVESSVDCRCSL